MNKDQGGDESSNVRENNGELEIIEKMPLLSGLRMNIKGLGACYSLLQIKQKRGSRFCIGFGGIGSILTLPA